MMVPLQLQRTETSEIAEDVQRGLTQYPKALPPRLFYDAAGSALFEQITGLPEYYLTRTERGIFEKHAGEMLDQTGQGLTLIELGAGTATKTSIIIRALMRRQLSATYYPVDVSEAALAVAESNLTAQFPGLSVRPLLGDYSQGLARLAHTAGRKLVLYIGSSIGNFELEEAGALLRNVRSALRPGDALLLGTDMVKNASALRAAYNDAAGVTARFNLNMLSRINAELHADFDLQCFRHIAEWNPRASRVELYLESTRQQRVRVADLGLVVPFIKGERIHTENSYKFTTRMVEQVLTDGGLALERSWTDRRGWFGVHLARVRE